MTLLIGKNGAGAGKRYSPLPLFLLLAASLINGGTTPLPTFLIRVGVIVLLAACLIRERLSVPRNFILPLFFSPPILSYPS